MRFAIAHPRPVRRPILSGIAPIIALALFFAVPTLVAAQQFSGARLSAWLNSIDLSVDWSASFESLRYDPVSRAATVTGLHIAGDGISIEINKLDIESYTPGSSGEFAARAISIPDFAIKSDTYDISLKQLRLADVTLPDASITHNRLNPFTSLVSLLAAAAKATTSGGSLGELVIKERIEGVTSWISYRNLSIGELSGGRIAHLRAGPVEMRSPDTNPLVDIKISEIDTRSIDLNALLDAYDPMRYIAGAGDLRWRPAIASARYRDITFTLPGIELSLGSAALEGLRVRQPRESFAPLLDAVMEGNTAPAVKRALTQRYMPNLLFAFGFDSFTVDQAELAAVGIERFGFDRFSLTDLSSDGFGEAALDNFEGIITGQGRIAADRLAMGGVAMPPIGEILTQFQRRSDPDLSAIMPRIGHVEIAGLDLQAVDFPGASLGSLRADLGNYVDSIPTEITFSLTDLDIAAASLPSGLARKVMTGLNYDRLRADAGLRLTWDESQAELTLSKFTIDIDDFGTLKADTTLTGVTRNAVSALSKDGKPPESVLFERGKLSFQDKSVVERGLSMRADLLDIPVDRLQQQLSGAVPLMFALFVSAEQLQQIVPALQGFLKAPGTLTAEAAPEPAVPASTLVDAARRQPQKLPALLDVRLDNTPSSSAEAGD